MKKGQSIDVYLLFFVSALLFGNDTNPAHPKHIGSIDPTCNVADVVKGKLSFSLHAIIRFLRIILIDF